MKFNLLQYIQTINDENVGYQFQPLSIKKCSNMTHITINILLRLRACLDIGYKERL